MKKVLLLLLAAGLLTSTSCKKTGPQGPPGRDGNANVKGEASFTVNSWALNTGENAYEASFNDSYITQDVADYGVVEIFLYYSSDNTWKPLPDIYNGTQFYFRYNTGGFDIYYGNVDGSTPAFPTGNWTFRAVVISPAKKQANPNTNWKNYNEAMQAINNNNNAVATTAQASAQ